MFLFLFIHLSYLISDKHYPPFQQSSLENMILEKDRGEKLPFTNTKSTSFQWKWELFSKHVVQCFSNPEHSAAAAAAAAAKSLQLCPTLCDPIDGRPPGSPVPGILQARTLEWVAISFSNVWKWKVKVKSLSCVRLPATPWTAAYQVLHPWDFPGKSTGVGCHCLLRSSILKCIKTSITEKKRTTKMTPMSLAKQKPGTQNGPSGLGVTRSTV